MPDPSLDKSIIRRSFLKIRSDISPLGGQLFAQQASRIFLENISLNDDDIISAYYPINNEITPIPIIERISENGLTTALPSIIDTDNYLIFRKWAIGDSLCRSSFIKIKEPKKDSEIVIPSIMIVPLLAFDKNGCRLGYGGGFYDRTINHFKQEGYNFISVGLAYSCQEIALLPNTPHDQKLDCVITEKEIIRF